METIVVRENLDLEVGREIVARLLPEEALNLAGRLVRGALRRIAAEEGFAEAFVANPPGQATN